MRHWLALALAVPLGCSTKAPVDPCRRLSSTYTLQLAQPASYETAELNLKINEGKVAAKLELVSTASPERLALSGEGRCLVGDLRLAFTGPKGQHAVLAAMMEPDLLRDPFGYFELRSEGETLSAFWKAGTGPAVAARP